MKNITFRAEEAMIKAARSRAEAEQTTLNEQLRCWLAAYAQTPDQLQRYDEVMKGIRGRMKVDRANLTRESMNEH